MKRYGSRIDYARHPLPPRRRTITACLRRRVGALAELAAKRDGTLAPRAPMMAAFELAERKRHMTDTQHLSSNVDRAEAKEAVLSRQPAREFEARIDWSHLGVLPPHKEWRRNRYVRARRRGLWKDRV